MENKYRTIIHTLEIQPNIPSGKNSSQWAKDAYNKNCPALDNIRKKENTYRLRINPHKLHPDERGHFVLRYGTIKDYERAMAEIGDMLCFEDYIIRRLDVALDSSLPYEQTAQRVRLPMLLLGQRMGMIDNYLSLEPFTLEPKTIRLQNGSFSSNTRRNLEIEHYNRSQVDQSKWNNDPVINRLELRAMGVHAGKKYDEASIIRNWIHRFEGLNREDLKSLEDDLTESIFSQWTKYRTQIGKDTTSAFNGFIREQRHNIYTHRQLGLILNQYKSGNMKSHKQNLLHESGKLFEFYSWKDVQREIESICGAMYAYLSTKTA